MSEYLIQGETLTGIADKIRPLLGLTGTMTPEQMQTNLTTEQANITAALAALTEKGVEVPEGANSNALAGLIAAIESGEGGGFSFDIPPLGFTKGASGSFVLENDTAVDKHIIETGFLFSQKNPVLIMVFSDDKENVYSASVKTFQFGISYDGAPDSSAGYKQTFSALSSTTTTGSYSEDVWGALSQANNILVNYGYRSYEILLKAQYYFENSKYNYYGFSLRNNYGTGYYLAGKRYYWLFLGTEVV